MTADQRAELLKRIFNDNKNQKLPFRECEKIAKDLNLTLEQVQLCYGMHKIIHFPYGRNSSYCNQFHAAVYKLILTVLQA